MSGYKYHDEDYKPGKGYSFGTEQVIKSDVQSQLELRTSELNEAIQTLLDVYENLQEGALKKKVYITLDKITTGDIDFILIAYNARKMEKLKCEYDS